MRRDPLSEFCMKPQRARGEVFTEDEMKQLLDIVGTRSHVGLRNKAILELLYSSGLRSSELCDLTLDDIWRENGMPLLRVSNGGTARVVPVGEIAMEHVEKFIKSARRQFLKEDEPAWLFLSIQGRKMQTISIASIVQKYAAQAGLKSYASPLMIRHTTASHLLQNGAPIRVICELMGYKVPDVLVSQASLEVANFKENKDIRNFHEKGTTA